MMIVLCFGLSFHAGSYLNNKKHLKQREQRSHTLIVFAIDKLEELKNQYDTDNMEALISNIYAAYEFSDDEKLSSALYELWNALIFDGENIAGKEADLINVLKEYDAGSIKNIAARIRIEK